MENNKEILQNNKLIAKFMGINVQKKWLGFKICNKNNRELGWTFTEKQANNVIAKDMIFHKS